MPVVSAFHLMNLAECYRLLGLKTGASSDEIKASYRRLARQFHPDTNPGDQQAKDKFIQLTSAYRFLLADAVAKLLPPVPPPKVVIRSAPTQPAPPRQPPPVQVNSTLSPIEQQLKESSYQQLQQLLKEQRFPRAIALVDGLAARLTGDPEVTQWQAIAYQRWGRYLIQQRQLDKARLYLKKALRTDPHNRSLWAEVEKDFRLMEQIF